MKLRCPADDDDDTDKAGCAAGHDRATAGVLLFRGL